MRYIFLMLLVVSVVHGISTAQVTVSATAMGTFAELGYSTITKLADLEFGTVFKGVAVTIEPTSTQAAEFLFNGSSNTTVDVTFTFPDVLTSGTNTISYQNSKSNPTYNTLPDAASATEFKHKNRGSAATGANGNLYIWVGGKVNTANNQAAGTYTGILTVTIVQP
jgi:hypothetical protein